MKGRRLLSRASPSQPLNAPREELDLQDTAFHMGRGGQAFTVGFHPAPIGSPPGVEGKLDQACC